MNGMSTQQAQSAVSVSAFVVAAIYAYRRLVETSTTATPAPPTGHFVIGFGFTYVLLAIAAQGAPQVGGMMAMLVALGDLLTNGKALTTDLTTNLKRTAGTGGTVTVGRDPNSNSNATPAGVTGSTDAGANQGAAPTVTSNGNTTTITVPGSNTATDPGYSSNAGAGLNE